MQYYFAIFLFFPDGKDVINWGWIYFKNHEKIKQTQAPNKMKSNDYKKCSLFREILYHFGA